MQGHLHREVFFVPGNYFQKREDSRVAGQRGGFRRDSFAIAAFNGNTDVCYGFITQESSCQIFGDQIIGALCSKSHRSPPTDFQYKANQ